MKYSVHTLSAARSFRPIEELAKAGDSEAMVARLIRQQEYGHSAKKTGRFLIDSVLSDVDKITNKETVRFGDVVFSKNAKWGPRYYSFDHQAISNDFDARGPCLDIHFWPRHGSSLRGIKSSMGAASEWLDDVADEYPVVFGCTYEELAKVAVAQFGFEAKINEDNMWVSSSHKKRISLAHTVFGILNDTDSLPIKMAGVAADTKHLAEQWSKYKNS